MFEISLKALVMHWLKLSFVHGGIFFITGNHLGWEAIFSSFFFLFFIFFLGGGEGECWFRDRALTARYV